MKHLKDNVQAAYAALHEGTIAGAELIEELKPLIDDCFVGKTDTCGESLQIEFFNGQKFILSETEVN